METPAPTRGRSVTGGLRPLYDSELLQWSPFDWLAIVGLLVAGTASRFFELDRISVAIFDEIFPLADAHNLLQHQPFRDTHPPLLGEMIALSIKVFGDSAWSWRLPNACFGIALIVITYLLGRRMFNSRLVGALASLFVLCDGLFLVDSRVALWEVVYLTFAAFAYLMAFRFEQTLDPLSRRRDMLWMAFALGLAMGSKLGIPLITVVLVTGFAIVVVALRASGDSGAQSAEGYDWNREILGILALVGAVSALTYLAVFLPNYWFGWWHGLGDQIASFRTEYHVQQELMRAHPHRYASPWWSWPLMMRPIRYHYAKEFVVTTQGAGVSSVHAIGNPMLWWGSLVAILIASRKALIQKNAAYAFLAVGYFLYVAMWIPIPRSGFIYYYMPALYLGFLALAGELAACWEGASQKMEEVLLMAVLAPVLILGSGAMFGLVTIVAIAVGYITLSRMSNKYYAGRSVCLLYVTGAVVLFVYFLPIWFGSPLSPEQFRARIWLRGPGLADWF